MESGVEIDPASPRHKIVEYDMRQSYDLFSFHDAAACYAACRVCTACDIRPGKLLHALTRTWHSAITQ